MAEVKPRLVFCSVSGVGTDSSEQGRNIWARVKGRTENALLALPSMRGVRSRTKWYQALHTERTLLPLPS
jgi:hypothetical protein